MSTHDESDVPAASGDHGIRAAQYVRTARRMRASTERQPSSIENQTAVIHDYARQHGFVIVKTYMDEGKSGSRIEGRDAMKRLLEDVRSGQAAFQAVLVQDTSRWGRFLNRYSRSRGANLGNLYKGASMPIVLTDAVLARMPYEEYRRVVAVGQEEASDLDSA